MPINRPTNEKELQKREAIGVIQASRFVRNYAKSHKKINISTICDIHKKIFENVWPEIAGIYRKENLSISGSDLLLPHYSKVPDLMKDIDKQLSEELSKLNRCEGLILDLTNSEENNEAIECIGKILHLVAWLHHKITFIHPFREGNGRTARLAGNLILEKYGLVGISVKIEKENKNEYRKALRQIDLYEDYNPLESIISEGITDRYEGVPMKYYH